MNQDIINIISIVVWVWALALVITHWGILPTWAKILGIVGLVLPALGLYLPYALPAAVLTLIVVAIANGPNSLFQFSSRRSSRRRRR